MEVDSPMEDVEEGEAVSSREGEQIGHSSSSERTVSDSNHSGKQQNIAGDFNPGFNFKYGQNPNPNTDLCLASNPFNPNLERNQNSNPNTNNGVNQAYHFNLQRNGNSSASQPKPNVKPDPDPWLSIAYNPNPNPSPSTNISPNPTPIPNKKTSNRVSPIPFLTFAQPNMEPSSTRQQPDCHQFIGAGPGMTNPFLTNQGPSHSGTKRSISEVTNPNFDSNFEHHATHYQYSNPNPGHYLGSNPLNPSLTYNQNPNLSIDHYVNANQAYYPNLQRNQNPNVSGSNYTNYRAQNPSLNPYQNPNINPHRHPSLNPPHIQNSLNLSPDSNPPQCSNQPEATLRSCQPQPQPPPRRVPALIQKMKTIVENINSILLSTELAEVPDKTRPGATKVVLKHVKRQDGGSTSNGSQMTYLGKPVTITYGDYQHVVPNVHPDQVSQLLSSVGTSWQPMQDSTKMLANSAQAPETALKLNVGTSGVINVEDRSNSRGPSPGKATLNGSNSQPAKTTPDNDGNRDQHVQPLQIDSVNNQNGEPLQTKTNDDQHVDQILRASSTERGNGQEGDQYNGNETDTSKQ